MKRIIGLLLAMVLLMGGSFAEITVELEICEISKYGNTVLNILSDQFDELGFGLGDDVTVSIGDFTADMPYLDGFYVYTGEHLLRRTSDGGLDICISHGNFSEAAGAEIGDKVTISLAEKGGSLALQGTGALQYTDERADYASDEVFANFRMMNLGRIAEGKLYRSASPINNDRNRASVACSLLEKHAVRTVMNLADSAEAIEEYAAAEDFDSAAYLELYEVGHVIALDMDVNFKSGDFNRKLVQGLSYLAEQEGPYLIHCNEGKDRAGFASALIAALMGASVNEIARDYMESYENYYRMDPEADAERYALIRDGNIMEMLRYIAGISEDTSLEDVDLAKAAEEYLLEFGMSEEKIEALKKNLSA